eukprot:6590855-Pyramimonas_sp.AAC.1
MVEEPQVSYNTVVNIQKEIAFGQRFHPLVSRQAQRLRHPTTPLTTGGCHPRHCAKPREVPTRPTPNI